MASIGFHTGPGGNMNGIGQHWRDLDAAAIPACLKSVDNYGPCFELSGIAAASGVPHVIIFRLSTQGQGDGYDYDVPPYQLAPIDAAILHWQKTRAKLPPEFDKTRVWVEPVNEVDKNRSEWLGQFAVALAERANADGYKVTLFGFASGEPEPNHWELPGMLAYLDYCATRSDAAAISLHEYSYDVTDMVSTYPDLIGRFLNLINTCAAHGIPYPTIHLTEWGWEYDAVPTPETAMIHIAWADGIYRPYATVKGLAIWYLGPGFGDIANQAQRLIAPVTQFNLYNPPTPPTPPTTPVNYKVVAHLSPQTISRAEYDLIANEAVPPKQSVVFSADDAWWPERWQDDIVAWLHAKGVAIVETRPQTPPPTEFRLSSPVQGIPLVITSGGMFNAPRDYDDPRYKHHEGLDLRGVNASGQPVKVIAAASGIVDGIRRTDPGTGYGIYVRVKTVHEGVTYILWYGHLATIPVALVVGQAIAVGQELGTAGNTGNSSGIHLHLTVQKIPGGLPNYIVASVIDSAPLLGLPASTLPGPNPPTGNALIGLHAPADPGFAAADFDEFTSLQPGIIKVLSSHSFEDINRLALEHLTAVFVVRAFLSFWENGQPRNISPAQFVTDTINDVKRAVNAIAAAAGQTVIIELHNEPNLYQEGLGGAWVSGTTFASWFLDVLGRYRAQLPQVKYAFPGLSPGGTVTGVRIDSTVFMDACLDAAAQADYLGVHAYWNSTNAPLSTALAVVDGYINQVPGKPIIVTEASNNQSGNADVMANEYVAFWQGLKARPRVVGVTYFVCNASNPAFAIETWTPRQLGAKVRAKL